MNSTFNHKLIATTVFVFTCTASFAQSAGSKETHPVSLVYWITAITIVVILFFMISVLTRLQALKPENTEAPVAEKWWKHLDRRLFTKAVPVEKEEDVLLDHDYDGIKELNNALPPWWKYGFYITIVVAVFYLLRFHVWKTGPDPEQEYANEMRIAAQQIEDYRKKAGDQIDEKTVTMAGASGIAEGDKIFHSNCFACHGAKGEGGVGPNLTDNYWLHGGTINDIFKTIKYGVPEKGMQSWEKTYSPSQIKDLASYIKTLVGTHPANPKAPQGDLFTDNKPDSANNKKDSSAVIK